MKHLLLVLFLLCAAGGHAQEASSMLPTPPYRYCALIVDDRYFSYSSRIALDYGQNVKGAPIDAEMAEMAKNIAGSRSVIDALNYLSRHGWEYLSTVNVPSQLGLPTAGYVTSETRYLLRRRGPQ